MNLLLPLCWIAVAICGVTAAAITAGLAAALVAAAAWFALTTMILSASE